jgi:hypothetical protein
VIVGGGWGTAVDAAAAGAEVVFAGRNPAEFAEPGIRTAFADFIAESACRRRRRTRLFDHPGGAAERAVIATTNGAVGFLAEALAVDLAPVRVPAPHSGNESGAPGRRGRGCLGGYPSLPPNPFVTGTTPHVDGGGRLSGNPDPLHGLRLFL